MEKTDTCLVYKNGKSLTGSQACNQSSVRWLPGQAEFLFQIPGMAITHQQKNHEEITDILVLAGCNIGCGAPLQKSWARPPIKPLNALPTPLCPQLTVGIGISFVRVHIVAGFNTKQVSNDATIARVAATIHTSCQWPMKNLVVWSLCPDQPQDCNTGSVTRCSAWASIPPRLLKACCNTIPTTTTTRAAGNNFIFFNTATLSQVMRMARLTAANTTAEGEYNQAYQIMSWRYSILPSANAISPSVSRSAPTAWGSCFKKWLHQYLPTCLNHTTGENNRLRCLPLSIPIRVEKYPPALLQLKIPPNDPRLVMAVKTMAVSPAAGPDTLTCDPLRPPTTRPQWCLPVYPKIMALQMPWRCQRHRGNATKKPPLKAGRSAFRWRLKFHI